MDTTYGTCEFGHYGSKVYACERDITTEGESYCDLHLETMDNGYYSRGRLMMAGV